MSQAPIPGTITLTEHLRYPIFVVKEINHNHYR